MLSSSFSLRQRCVDRTPTFQIKLYALETKTFLTPRGGHACKPVPEWYTSRNFMLQSEGRATLLLYQVCSNNI